jgi:sulfatase maturation enzyme AslB (radical SAM superfamily)
METNKAIWPVTSPVDWCGDFRHVFDVLEGGGLCGVDCEYCGEEEEEYDKSVTLDRLRSSMSTWKSKHPDGFDEIIKEIKKKNVEDAYFMIRTAVVYDVPFFDNLPQTTVTGEVIKLNSRRKAVK